MPLLVGFRELFASIAVEVAGNPFAIIKIGDALLSCQVGGGCNPYDNNGLRR